MGLEEHTTYTLGCDFCGDEAGDGLDEDDGELEAAAVRAGWSAVNDDWACPACLARFLACGRCHKRMPPPVRAERKRGSREVYIEEPPPGWEQRLDGALKPAKVWLCPACVAEVAVIHGGP